MISLQILYVRFNCISYCVSGSCIVTTARIISWDNATIPHILSSCYTLAAADCTRNPKFAFLMKRVKGPKPLVCMPNKFGVSRNQIQLLTLIIAEITGCQALHRRKLCGTHT